MKTAIFINSVIPILYLFLYLMLLNDLIEGNNRVIVAEYGSGLILIQLISFIIGFRLTKSKYGKIALLILLALTSFFILQTVEKFNTV